MFELSPFLITALLFGALITLLIAGLPVVFAMGALGVLAITLLWQGSYLNTLLVASAFDISKWYSLIAMPLFILMAMIMRSAGIIEDLFFSLRLWFAGIPGGLAMAVVWVCVVVAALSGVVVTAIVILGITAVPIMLKYGYSKEMALGPIMAGTCLANLIPPSNGFIVYGAIANVSVGKLFMSGFFPGLILATLSTLYIGVRCFINPKLGPPLPPEERVGFREKLASTRYVIAPVLIILACLGSIFFGITTPTEAASVGVIGALIAASTKKQLNWQVIRDACIETGKITSMVIWIFIGAYCFKGAFVMSGGVQLITDWIGGLNIAPMAIIGVMQVVFIILGCFVPEIVIFLLTLPVFLPIVDSLHFSRLWFGALFLTNLQMAYLTPPFGFALFYMRSVVPKGISMSDIIRSAIPFIFVQAIGTLIVMFVPQVALWLPSLMK